MIEDVSVEAEQKTISVVEIIIDENSSQAVDKAVKEAKEILEELKAIDVSQKLNKGNYEGTAETLSFQAKIYENGELQIFRKPGTPPDPDNKLPNVGDWCIGFVEGQFINATYLGGNPLLLTSYDI